MKNLRKMSLLLLLTLIITGLSACSGDDNTSNPTANTPVLTAITPNSGQAGIIVTLTGKYFGTDKTKGSVTFNSTSVTSISSWSDTEIKLTVPGGATSGLVYVTVNGLKSNGITFTVNSEDWSQWFPTNDGTWWLYDRYKVDENGARLESVLLDSAYVVGDATWDGKSCKKVYTLDRKTLQPTDTSYFKYENNKYWINKRPVAQSAPYWLLAFDADNSTWEVASITLNNFELIKGVPLNGIMKITGTKGATKDFTIGSKVYSGIEVTADLKFDGTVPIIGAAKFYETTKLYFAKNAGLVYTIDGPIQLEMNGNKTTITGVSLWEKTLTAISVK